MAEYPLPKFHFQVDWGGAKLSFTEVTGLSMEQEVIEYRHSDSKAPSKIKMPGMRKYSNITMKRGTFQADFDFYNWLGEIQTDRANTRRDVIIKLLNEASQPMAAWKAERCFPVKVQASDLKSDGNEVAIESIEIAIESLSLVK